MISSSTWSPAYSIFIDTFVDAEIGGDFLIGPSAGVSVYSSTNCAFTVGENVIATSTSSVSNKTYFGYQGLTVAVSSYTTVVLGAVGPGKADASPPAILSVASFLNMNVSSPADVLYIAVGLQQNPYVTQMDGNGNTKIAMNRWIQYDSENRPIKIITADATLTQFQYDYEGQRTRKTITPYGGSTSTTTFIGTIYDVVAGGISTKYIYAGGQRVAMKTSSGQTYYYLTDHLGSTNLVTDSNGVVVSTATYLPFGSAAQLTGALSYDNKYTGQRIDDTTGLYYYNARYYDPSIGKFITPDTSIDHPYDPQSLNRFAYVRNNPIIYSDPTGHWKWKNFGKSALEVGGYAAMFVPGLQPYAVYIVMATSMANAALSGANGAGIFAAGVIGGISAGYGMAASGAVGAAGKAMGTGLLARGTSALLSGAAAGFVSGGMTAAMNGASGSGIFRGAYQGAAMGAATSVAVFGISEYMSSAKASSHAPVKGTQLAGGSDVLDDMVRDQEIQAKYWQQVNQDIQQAADKVNEVQISIEQSAATSLETIGETYEKSPDEVIDGMIENGSPEVRETASFVKFAYDSIQGMKATGEFLYDYYFPRHAQ